MARRGQARFSVRVQDSTAATAVDNIKLAPKKAVGADELMPGEVLPGQPPGVFIVPSIPSVPREPQVASRSSSSPSASSSPPAALVLVVLLGVAAAYLLGHHSPSDVAWLAPAGYSFKGSLLSGASAGVSRGMSRILTFPLDTIKTRQQAVLSQRKVSRDHLAEESQHVRKNKLFDGIVPMLLIAAPSNAAFFATYDYLLAMFASLHLPVEFLALQDMVAALVASLPANLFRIPAEVTKQRVQTGVEKNALSAASSILQREGVGGLYVGGGAHLLRELPFNAIQMAVFQQLKTWLLVGGGLSVGYEALLGALAAGAAGLVTQPMDTIKTGQMIDKSHRGGLARLQPLESVKSVYARFGITGLYLGWWPRFLLCFIGGGFYFLAHDLFSSVKF